MLTAVAALGALVFTAQSLVATRDQIGLTEQGQLTDRFGKAVEQLGNKDNLEVRLGGIYALERLARDSVRDHPTVMEVLSAYVREHARRPCSTTAPTAGPSTDMQAVLTVIGRRDKTRDRDRLFLNGVCLHEAELANADLTVADLTGADLTVADLSDADLSGAFLFGADLTGANLTGANLTGAVLARANLTGTRGIR